MLTKEEIALLTPEQKQELLEMLKPENPVAEEPEPEKGEETPNENPEQVVGGVADGLTIEDIALKHNVSVDDLKAQLAKGIEVEKEHTDDPKKAEEIAKDHLAERPDYYVELAKVEQNPIDFSMFDQKIDDFGKSLEQKMNDRLADFGNQFQEAMVKVREEIARLTNENAELRRRQPTGFPGPVVETRAPQTPQEQKTNDIAKGYFQGRYRS